MATKKKTGFDKYFLEQMKRPHFAAQYARARAEIKAVDDLIRALDAGREAVNTSQSLGAARTNIERSEPKTFRLHLDDARAVREGLAQAGGGRCGRNGKGTYVLTRCPWTSRLAFPAHELVSVAIVT
jgi:hypothetical protein